VLNEGWDHGALDPRRDGGGRQGSWAWEIDGGGEERAVRRLRRVVTPYIFSIDIWG